MKKSGLCIGIIAWATVVSSCSISNLTEPITRGETEICSESVSVTEDVYKESYTGDETTISVVYGEEEIQRAKLGELVYLGRDFQIDLDEDGQKERVVLELHPSERPHSKNVTYSITIGDREYNYQGDISGSEEKHKDVVLYLTTMDGERMALVLIAHDPVYVASNLFTYTEEGICRYHIPMAVLLGYDTDKRGLIIETYLEFLDGVSYTCICKYTESLDRFVNEEGYYEYKNGYRRDGHMSPYRVKKSFFVYGEYLGQTPKALLPVGTEFTLIGGNAAEWAQIQLVETNETYWIHLSGFADLINENGVLEDKGNFFEDIHNE